MKVKVLASGSKGNVTYVEDKNKLQKDFNLAKNWKYYFAAPLVIILAAIIGILSINKEIATCIYSGILTDTGAFRYNVQPETFEFAGMLLETGIDIARIYKTLYVYKNIAIYHNNNNVNKIFKFVYLT